MAPQPSNFNEVTTPDPSTYGFTTVATGRLTWAASGPYPKGWVIGQNETVWRDNALVGRFIWARANGGNWTLVYDPRGDRS